MVDGVLNGLSLWRAEDEPGELFDELRPGLLVVENDVVAAFSPGIPVAQLLQAAEAEAFEVALAVLGEDNRVVSLDPFE